jgi:Fe-S oxidoreductase
MSVSEMRADLIAVLEENKEKCIRCGLCVRKCEFLKRYGNPGDIAVGYDAQTAGDMPFKCSQCGLCGAVCPERLQPAEMFLTMRRQAVDRGEAPYRAHRRILNFERRGISRPYTFEGLPQDCRTVFFPGCSLPGTRPVTTMKLIEMLEEKDKNLGVVLHCCAKPSHDLGMQDRFEAVFMPLRDRLLDAGVKTVLTACPNCHKVFTAYGGNLRVKSVYEELSGNRMEKLRRSGGAEFCVHDSCAVRNEPDIHKAVRGILKSMGHETVPLKNEGYKTYCCGEGGAVALVDKNLAGAWTNKRAAQAKKRQVVTYCTGCHGFLSAKTKTVHLADLIVDPESAHRKKPKVSRAPLTYLNRWRLVRRLRKNFSSS